MPVTTRQITNVGFPPGDGGTDPGDPACTLPGTLYIPDSTLYPPPWNCVVAVSAMGFTTKNGAPGTPCMDLANAGFMCLFSTCRLLNPIRGQTTTGKYPQQSNDVKLAIRAMRSNPFTLGYSVSGWVAALGGSGSGSHALFMACDGAYGDDKADAAIALSPVADMGDRAGDVRAQFIAFCTAYGDTAVTGDLTDMSPINLDLANASPILHYNGDHEIMPLTQQTLLSTAMTADSNPTYSAHENTGSLGRIHSFAYWGAIKDVAIPWLQEQIL